jgi:hypothetical protein
MKHHFAKWWRVRIRACMCLWWGPNCAGSSYIPFGSSIRTCGWYYPDNVSIILLSFSIAVCSEFRLTLNHITRNSTVMFLFKLLAFYFEWYKWTRPILIKQGVSWVCFWLIDKCFSVLCTLRSSFLGGLDSMMFEIKRLSLYSYARLFFVNVQTASV